MYRHPKTKWIFALYLVVIYTSCAYQNDYSKLYRTEIYNIDNTEAFVPFSPPNGIRIDDNFYADATEISNIDYAEYLFWLEMVYGEESEEYRDAYPDSSVWSDISRPSYANHYYTHPVYLDYPLVGITLKQAEEYSKWRTDRVSEVLLVERGLMEPISLERDSISPINAQNYFTIERYQKGTCKGIVKREDVFLPIFSIPTEVEWNNLAQGTSLNAYGIDSLDPVTKKRIRKELPLFCTNELIILGDSIDYSKAAAPIFSNITNTYGLYNTIGNVAEMVRGDSIAKGGSWYHSLNEAQIEKSIPFTSANAWTGFRNVARWKLVKVNKNH